MTRTSFAMSLLASVCLSIPASAQQGLQVIEQTWEPINRETHSQTRFQNVSFFVSSIKTFWPQALPIIEENIKDRLSQTPLFLGQKAYDISVALAAPEAIQARVEGQQLLLTMALRGNHAQFHTTQPTPAGKWADPGFMTSFNAEIEIVLQLSSPKVPFTLVRDSEGYERAIVRIRDGKVDSTNLAGDVTKAVSRFAGDVSKFLGGPDFWGDIEGRINRSRRLGSAIYPSLQLINALLSPSLFPGSTLSLQQRDGMVTILAARNDYQVPTKGSATVSGVVRWSRALGVPTSTLPFVFSAQVQAGPGTEGSLFTPQGKLQWPVSGRLTETAEGYEYHYTVENLPNEITLDLPTLSLAKGVNWTALAGQSVVFSPRRWQGSLKIQKPVVGSPELPLMPRPVIRRVGNRINPVGKGSLSNINFDLNLFAPTVLR